MYELTQSALMMSTLRLIEFFVSGVLGVAAGIFVDRINRKNILVSAALLQWLTIGCLTLLLFTNNLQLWNLYFIGFFFYTSGLLHTNATHAALPQIIHKSQLVDGNAKIGIFSNTVRLIGFIWRNCPCRDELCWGNSRHAWVCHADARFRALVTNTKD